MALQREDCLSPFQLPTHPGALHAVLHQVLAGAFRHATGNRVACRQVFVIAHVFLVVFIVRNRGLHGGLVRPLQLVGLHQGTEVAQHVTDLALQQHAQMMRHEFSRLRTLLRIQAMGHLPEPFQRVEQVQNPYGLGKPFCRQLPQLAFPIHDTDARLLVCRVPPTTLHKNLEEQHRCGGQHLPFLKPGHLCPHMLVLRFGPLPGTLSPTHLVDHVFGSTREAGLGVNRSHIRHLFFPGALPAAFLLPRQTLDRRRRRRLFLDSRDSCRFRACGISSLFFPPQLQTLLATAPPTSAAWAHPCHRPLSPAVPPLLRQEEPLRRESRPRTATSRDSCAPPCEHSPWSPTRHGATPPIPQRRPGCTTAATSPPEHRNSLQRAIPRLRPGATIQSLGLPESRRLGGRSAIPRKSTSTASHAARAGARNVSPSRSTVSPRSPSPWASTKDRKNSRHMVIARGNIPRSTSSRRRPSLSACFKNSCIRSNCSWALKISSSFVEIIVGPLLAEFVET